MNTRHLSEADQIACWPKEWRDDFLRQKELLRMDQDDPLEPSEYLQCRFEDRCEVLSAEEVDLAQRHHAVFVEVIKVLAASLPWPPMTQSISDRVRVARTWADLACPASKAQS